MSRPTSTATHNIKLCCSSVSGSVIGNFVTSCVIEDFSKLDSSAGKYYIVQKFKLEEDPVKKWFLVIYPGGEDQSDMGSVNFSLFTDMDIHKCSMGWTWSILDSKEVCVDKGQTEMTDWNSLEFDDANPDDLPGKSSARLASTERNFLLDRISKDDTFVIRYAVTYSKSIIQQDESYVCFTSQVSPYLKLISDFKALWGDKRSTDVVFSVEGTDIPVHSLVITARSKVFKAMFDHDTVEGKSRKITVTDFSANTMESMLKFLYSAEIGNINTDLAMELIQAADKYDLIDLKTYCSNFLFAHLDDGNVCPVLLAADISNVLELKKEAIQYFCDNNSSDFEDYKVKLMERPNVLCDIIDAMREIEDE